MYLIFGHTEDVTETPSRDIVPFLVGVGKQAGKHGTADCRHKRGRGGEIGLERVRFVLKPDNFAMASVVSGHMTSQ